MKTRLLAAVAVLGALPALATVIAAHTIESMAQSAPVIVRASAGQNQTRWDDGRRHIDTFTEVMVSEVLKGHVQPGASLMLRNPGGVVDKMGQHVEGTPTFTAGEELILFLEPAADDPSVFLVWGLRAGKVSLTENGTGQLRATRDLKGLVLLERGAKPEQRIFNADKPEDLGTPQQFIARIRKAIGATGGKR